VRDSTTGQFSRTKVAAVQPGDVLAASGKSTVRVRCVVRIALDAELDPLLRFSEGLQITPKHPVRVAGGQWCRPKDLPGAQRMEPENLFASKDGCAKKYHVYNFLLDKTHVITVNGMECVTWGHGLTDQGVGHPYFGNMAAVERDLSAMRGWSSGVVSVGGCCRDLVTHRIVGLCSAV